MKQNFIRTMDSTTADILRKCGFQEMKTNNKNIYTFLNDTTLKFSECVDIKKIQYSNMLSI